MEKMTREIDTLSVEKYLCAFLSALSTIIDIPREDVVYIRCDVEKRMFVIDYILIKYQTQLHPTFPICLKE